jgi:transposase
MFRQTTQYGQSTDSDARAMTSAGRGTNIVGYNLQAAVDAEHHLIVAHELLNIGNDCGQLSSIAAKAKDAMGIDTLDAIADKGYFEGEDNRVESRRCGTYL